MNSTNEEPVEILWRMQQQAMAGDHAPPQREPDESKWRGLAFSVGEIGLVVGLTGVSDVLDCPDVAPVPRTQPWLRGVCNVRGGLHSVVDLGMFLGAAPPVGRGAGKLLVLNERVLKCTLLVSKVFGLRYFTEEQRRLDATMLDPAVRAYAVQCFVHEDQPWGVLDLERLTAADEFLNVNRTAATTTATA